MERQGLIYLDNSATSYPKPEGVYEAVLHAMREAGGNPGRAGHRMALAANRLIFRAREPVASLFGVRDSARIIFTSSATEALNLSIRGCLRPGDHVISSLIEHSSVSRPLHALMSKGVEVERLGCTPEGVFDLHALKRSVRSNTALIALTHASNVIGTLEPIAEIGAFARARGIPLLVDAAQTAGSISIDVEAMGIDLLVAAGHKSLYGLQGTGILYIAPHVNLEPLKVGGTGAGEGGDDQPLELPDRFEAGTMNTPGIAGLGAGVRFILEEGRDRIRQKEVVLLDQLMAGLAGIRGVTLYGTTDPSRRASLIAFNVTGEDPARVAHLLDQEYGIMSRSGLHCAPDAHRFLGTYPGGAVRLSPGYFNTPGEIDEAVRAVAEIAGGR